MEGTMIGPDKKKHTMSFGGNTVETFVKEGKTLAQWEGERA
jgi:hypothetical protein